MNHNSANALILGTPITAQVPKADDQDTVSLEKVLSHKDDLQKLDILVMEMAKDADRIDKVPKTRFNTAQDATRRASIVSRMAQTIIAKRDAMKSEGLDPESPAIQILVQYILEQVKATMVSAGFNDEEVQLFLTSLPERMEGWEDEVARRVKRQLFHLNSGAEPNTVEPTANGRD